MKSIFALAVKTLDDWQKAGLSKTQIEALLAQNEQETQHVKTVLSGAFLRAREDYHLRFNEIYFTRIIPQLDDDLELPDKDVRAESLAAEKALAERQMRWGALKLIAFAAKDIKKGEEFPFKSAKLKLEKLYNLCFPKSVLEWDMSLHMEPGRRGQRKDFTRKFTTQKDAAQVMDILNTALFTAYGLSADAKIVADKDNAHKLFAPEGMSAEALLTILRMEQSWRWRKDAAQKLARS